MTYNDESISNPFIVIHIIYIIEFILLALLISIDIIKLKRNQIQLQTIQKFLYLLAFILIPLRISEKTVYYKVTNFTRGLIVVIGYCIYFCIYNLVFYAWYLPLRLQLYTSYLFHLSSDIHLRILSIAKQVILCMICIALGSMITVTILVSNGMDYTLPDDEICLPFRLIMAVLILINLISLLGIGILLLHKINQFSTQKPVLLIGYLYFNMISLGIGLIIMGLFVAFSDFFVRYLL